MRKLLFEEGCCLLTLGTLAVIGMAPKMWLLAEVAVKVQVTAT